MNQYLQNKPGVLPKGLLNKLRLFIKQNSYGQYIALFLMSIMAIYNIVVYNGSVASSTNNNTTIICAVCNVCGLR